MPLWDKLLTDVLLPAAKDVLGRDPLDILADPLGEIFRRSGGTGQSAAPTGVQATGAAPELGGATMDWDQTFRGANTWDWAGAGVIGNGVGSRRIMPYTGGIIPSGFRVAQRSARRPTAGYPAGVYLVPRRSMNPLNPRALMRAERRMNSFTTWVKRHFRIAAAAPKRRKGGKFTKRRR